MLKSSLVAPDKPVARDEPVAPVCSRCASKVAPRVYSPNAIYSFSILFASLLSLTGCPPAPPDNTGIYNNTTDLSNASANYVGSAACSDCHPSYADLTATHGHTHALKPITGQPPQYPDVAPRVGVPSPPPGFNWSDISYVIGGYLFSAHFVNQLGYVLTTGETGVDTEWILPFTPTGATAEFIAFRPDRQAPLPFSFDWVSRVTTGAEPPAEPPPPNQGDRPGIAGIWFEAGVRCEACHGPGGNHVPNPQARDLFVDPDSSETCGRCHTWGDDPAVIRAEDGFLHSLTEYAQLQASGGHSNFSCGFCHDPHISTVYEPERAIRNDCRACHGDMNMARHQGVVFARASGYQETMTCESCHMPFAVLNGRPAGQDVAGTLGRMADGRAHIFRISTEDEDFTGIFSADGQRLVTDAQGRAALTVDFVCLRCHTTGATLDNTAFPLSINLAADIAAQLHSLPQQRGR